MKRKLAILLAAMLVVSMLAACGTAGGSSTMSTPQSGEPIETTEAPITETETPQDEPEEQTGISFPLTETVELSFMNTFNPGLATIINGWEDVATVQKLEEMTNVHIEYLNTTPDVKSERFNIALMSDELPDIVEGVGMMYEGGVAGAVEEGYFLNLNDYIDLMPNYVADMNDSDMLRKASYVSDGVIGCLYKTTEGTNVNGIIVRQDWLDELEISAPVTYEDTHEVLKAMQSLGVEHPLILPSFLDYQWNCFAGNFNTVGAFDIIGMSQQLFVVDGEVRYGMYTQEYEDYITMLAEWYAEGLIDPDFIGYEMVRDYQEKLNNGLCGYYLNDLSNLETTQNDTADSGANWVGINLPVQEEGQINHLTNYYDSIDSMTPISIAASCQNPEVAAAWLDYQRSDDIEFMFDFGVEGQTFNYGADGKTIEWTDLIVNNPDGLTQQQALTVYTGNEGGSVERNMTLYSDRQMDAVTKWQTNVDGDYIYPTTIALDGEDASRASVLLADIKTYISENSLQFVTGEKSLDEFEEFRQTLKDSGIEEVIEIYQRAYDEYMAS